jgi:hypothetical protein
LEEEYITGEGGGRYFGKTYSLQNEYNHIRNEQGMMVVLTILKYPFLSENSRIVRPLLVLVLLFSAGLMLTGVDTCATPPGQQTPTTFHIIGDEFVG